MWFDVNDSRISCIRERDLQRQFSGKESAYMLFYRRKNLSVSGSYPSRLLEVSYIIIEKLWSNGKQKRATCSKALLRKHGFKSHVARFTPPVEICLRTDNRTLTL